jgi:hypothetical protein
MVSCRLLALREFNNYLIHISDYGQVRSTQKFDCRRDIFTYLLPVINACCSNGVLITVLKIRGLKLDIRSCQRCLPYESGSLTSGDQMDTSSLDIHTAASIGLIEVFSMYTIGTSTHPADQLSLKVLSSEN